MWERYWEYEYMILLRIESHPLIFNRSAEAFPLLIIDLLDGVTDAAASIKLDFVLSRCIFSL